MLFSISACPWKIRPPVTSPACRSLCSRLTQMPLGLRTCASCFLRLNLLVLLPSTQQPINRPGSTDESTQVTVALDVLPAFKVRQVSTLHFGNIVWMPQICTSSLILQVYMLLHLPPRMVRPSVAKIVFQLGVPRRWQLQYMKGTYFWRLGITQTITMTKLILTEDGR